MKKLKVSSKKYEFTKLNFWEKINSSQRVLNSKKEAEMSERWKRVERVKHKRRRKKSKILSNPPWDYLDFFKSPQVLINFLWNFI